MRRLSITPAVRSPIGPLSAEIHSLRSPEAGSFPGRAGASCATQKEETSNAIKLKATSGFRKDFIGLTVR